MSNPDLIPVDAIEREIAAISTADAEGRATENEVQMEWCLLQTLRWWRRNRRQAEREQEAAG